MDECKALVLGGVRDPELRALLGRYLLAFAAALKDRYRGDGNIENGVRAYRGDDNDGDGESWGEPSSSQDEPYVASRSDLERVLRPAEFEAEAYTRPIFGFT